MAAQQNFRTSFNGFNREDVVHYIEYLNSKHTAEVNQLKSEVEFLRGKVAQETVEAPKPVDNDPIIEQQAARIRELFDQNKILAEELEKLQAEKDELEGQLSEAVAAGTIIEDQLNTAIAEKGELNDRLEAAKQQQTSFKSRMEEELAAYRRAERAERMAKERANQMYSQANGVIADATVKVDEAAAQISELSETVMAQLQLLQLAVAGSTSALKEAAATMYTIHPETEE